MRRSRRLREAAHLRAAAAAGVAPEDWRDWAGGVPAEGLAKVAGKLIALKKGDIVAWLEEEGKDENYIHNFFRGDQIHQFPPLFAFALVCKDWRKAQLKVGGQLHTTVRFDVILPGRLEMLKWALAEGCPTQNDHPRAQYDFNMVHEAARFGHVPLMEWLVNEEGLELNERVFTCGAEHLEVLHWAHENDCPFDEDACAYAAASGKVENLQWLRANGFPWNWR